MLVVKTSSNGLAVNSGGTERGLQADCRLSSEPPVVGAPAV